MITIYNAQKEVQQILEDVNDYRQLLDDGQFITGLPQDALRAIHVLGLKNASRHQIHWHRGAPGTKKTIFNDWVITVK